MTPLHTQQPARSKKKKTLKEKKIEETSTDGHVPPTLTLWFVWLFHTTVCSGRAENALDLLKRGNKRGFYKLSVSPSLILLTLLLNPASGISWSKSLTDNMQTAQRGSQLCPTRVLLRLHLKVQVWFCKQQKNTWKLIFSDWFEATVIYVINMTFLTFTLPYIDLGSTVEKYPILTQLLASTL